MKLLKTITNSSLLIKRDPESKEITKRKSVRVIVFNDKEKIAIMHVSKRNFYILPGGEIEKSDLSPKDAVIRECAEELGFKVIILKEIGKIIEIRSQSGLRNESFCFIAKTLGNQFEQKMTEKEIEHECKIEWVSLEDAELKIRSSDESDEQKKFIKAREITLLNKTKKMDLI